MFKGGEVLPRKIFTTQEVRVMSNVHIIRDIDNRGPTFGNGHQLSSAYEQELEEKLHSALRSKAETKDLSKKLMEKYSEREKVFHRTSTDVANKLNQLNASNTKLQS